MVTIQMNGRPVELPAGASVSIAVERATNRPAAFAQGVAVAVNEEVVPRGEWAITKLRDGDEIEVLMAVQGG